jgi:hypothetical protein
VYTTGNPLVWSRGNESHGSHREIKTEFGASTLCWVARCVARLGPISFAGGQHAGRDADDYASDEVQDMAQQLASEHARSIWSVQDEALAGIRSETTNDVTRVRTVSLASVPQRIASEVAATLRLIQNLDRPD